MHDQRVALAHLLRFCPALLDDATIDRLFVLCNGLVSVADLGLYYRERCLCEKYATIIDTLVNQVSVDSLIRWQYLFHLNNAHESSSHEASVSYAQVGQYLLSVPLDGVAMEETVRVMRSSLMRVIRVPFNLFHMYADGSVGPHCEDGQSGSRFVVQLVHSNICRRSTVAGRSSRRRFVSLEYPRLPVLSRTPNPPNSWRSRAASRDTGDAHAVIRHQLFRSHSADFLIDNKQISDISRKVCDMYLSEYAVDGGVSEGVSPRDTREKLKSSIFVSYEVVVFDTKKLAQVNLVSPPIVSWALDMFSTQIMRLGIRPSPPLDGYFTNRAAASAEWSKCLPPNAVAELLELSDGQGVGERPLLVQLERGQWKRLCPNFFSICSHMLGLTPWGEVPLPEEGLGRPAERRLRAKFTQKFMSNGVWKISVKVEKIIGKVIHVPGDSNPPVRMDRRNSLFWDCMDDSDSSDQEQVSVCISRFASLAELVEELEQQWPLKEGFSWKSLVQFDSVGRPSDLLGKDLKWCTGEHLELEISPLGGLRAVRPRQYISAGGVEGSTRAKPEKLEKKSPVKPVPRKMLWDVVGSWDSEETRRQMTPVSQELVVASSCSDAVRRERTMEKAAKGIAKNDELEELGIDPNTEYSRWWEDGSSKCPTPRDGDEVGALGLTNAMKGLSRLSSLDEFETVVEEERSDEKEITRPTTPTSPVPRRRKSVLQSYEPRLLRSSKDTRQFEFHPVDPNLILAGSRSGVVSLIDASSDVKLGQRRIDTSPILGIAWLRCHMNLALYGASASGIVGCLKIMGSSEYSLIEHQPVGRFPNISSVSVNCTDDFFLLSGFSRDLALHDTFTGRRILDFRDVHNNFINIVRFSHSNPFLFATSSFDCTCKLWDLRENIAQSRTPLAVFPTPTLNVMCCFSPNDENLLVSGLDNQVTQLNIRTNQLVSTIPSETLAQSIPPTNSNNNYRRSVYLGSDGESFITAGTDENFVRVIDSRSGECKNVCSFDGLLQCRNTNPCKAMPDCDPSPVKSGEYVQSLRGHPIFPNDIGVLLYPYDRSRPSYICTMQIPR